MKEVKPHTSSVSRCWRGLWICMSKSSVRLHWFRPTEKLKGNKNPVGLYHNLLKLIHMISLVVVFPNWGCDSWISGKNMADRKNNEPHAVGEVSKSFYGRFFFLWNCQKFKPTTIAWLHESQNYKLTSLQGTTAWYSKAWTYKENMAEFQLTLIFTRAASTPPGCPAMDTCSQ